MAGAIDKYSFSLVQHPIGIEKILLAYFLSQLMAHFGSCICNIHGRLFTGLGIFHFQNHFQIAKTIQPQLFGKAQYRCPRNIAGIRQIINGNIAAFLAMIGYIPPDD